MAMLNMALNDDLANTAVRYDCARRDLSHKETDLNYLWQAIKRADELFNLIAENKWVIDEPMNATLMPNPNR